MPSVPQSMMIDTPSWGDNLLAGFYGSQANVSGTDTVSQAVSALNRFPEPFPADQFITAANGTRAIGINTDLVALDPKNGIGGIVTIPGLVPQTDKVLKPDPDALKDTGWFPQSKALITDFLEGSKKSAKGLLIQGSVIGLAVALIYLGVKNASD